MTNSDQSPKQSDPSHDNPQRPIGRGMLTMAWICVLGLLTWVFGNWEENQLNPNRTFVSEVGDNGARQVTLEANRYHHYVATGSINRYSVIFLLDTGATEVVVPGELAKELGLAKGPARQTSTANGVITTYVTRLEELQLGPILLFDVRAAINPYMDGEEILLGMSALKQLELTQKGDFLTLKQYADD